MTPQQHGCLDVSQHKKFYDIYEEYAVVCVFGGAALLIKHVMQGSSRLKVSLCVIELAYKYA